MVIDQMWTSSTYKKLFRQLVKYANEINDFDTVDSFIFVGTNFHGCRKV